MSVAGSQRQTFLRLLRALLPYWRSDVGLPARIQALLARHKEFGSRDRRLYRELIYTAIRYLPWIEPLLSDDPERAAKVVAWLAAETRDTRAFRAELCGDWPAAPSLAQRAAFLGADPVDLLPAWFRDECPAVFASPELDAQLARAPLWLRLQTDVPADVASEFASKGWRWTESPVLRGAWQVHDDADLTKAAAFARGAFEIQDLGSQLLLASVGVQPGETWLDTCAGAGGKTLQLARLLGPEGHIEAQDVRPDALQELITRATRASRAPHATRKPGAECHPIDDIPGAAKISVRLAREPSTTGALYDGVVVDAPCSGSGTWRRSPHLKWTTSAETLAAKAVLQSALLDEHAPRVRPGGRLVYATCSLARRENEQVVTSFLTRHPEFEPAPFFATFGFDPSSQGLTILPARHDTDGFFVASLRRRR